MKKSVNSKLIIMAPKTLKSLNLNKAKPNNRNNQYFKGKNENIIFFVNAITLY